MTPSVEITAIELSDPNPLKRPRSMNVKNQIIVTLTEAGPITMREIVRAMRVSARVLKSSLDALIAVGAVTTYTDEDHERVTGEPTKPWHRNPDGQLYSIRYASDRSVHW